MLANKLKEKYNKLADFFDRPAWKNRTLFYFTIFTSIALAFIIVFGTFNLIFPNFTFPNNNINYDNERYLLSALVQSLAATIALVITLSLVAVQLAAQSYSARVIDVYKRNPDMWILLCIYIITIFYGLGLIKVVELSVYGINMEGAIFVAYFMGFFAFVCLVPYMLKTLDLLKPSTVILLMAEDITKENVDEYLKNSEDVAEKDPIQPIIDIINNSLERNDYETVKNGFRAITNSIMSIYKNPQLEEEEKIFNHIIEHVERLGIQALKRQNEDSTSSAIVNIENIGINAINYNFSKTALKTVKALENIGMKVIETSYQNILKQNIKAMGIIGARATHENMKECTEAALSALMDIGPIAADKEYGSSAIEASEAIGIIGNKAADKKDGIAAQVAIEALRRVGIKSAEKKLDISTMVAARELGSIGIKTAENKLNTATEVVARALLNIAIKAAPNEFGIAAITATERLGDVGAKAAENKLENATFEAENALKLLLKKANENRWEFVVKESKKGLQNIEQKRNETG